MVNIEYIRVLTYEEAVEIGIFERVLGIQQRTYVFCLLIHEIVDMVYSVDDTELDFSLSSVYNHSVNGNEHTLQLKVKDETARFLLGIPRVRRSSL